MRTTVRGAVSARGATPVAARSPRRTARQQPSASSRVKALLLSKLVRSKVVSCEAAAVAVEETAVAVSESEEVGPVEGVLVEREDLRNIAIIAHVDHGKTTLVDAMLAQSNVFRDNQQVEERVMDSNDLERERGITILSKNTSITYKGSKINIIDTPGHADFGGEVERVLRMTDGVLLLVDSVEGPMPQTRFVLKKALELGIKVLVVVNKIDRPAARPDYVIDNTFELFCDLGAPDDLCDFPVVYCSGMQGIAGMEPENLADDLEPLFETIMREVPAPKVVLDGPTQMLVTSIDFDPHKGRIAIGRVGAGTMRKGEFAVVKPGADKRNGKVGEVFTFTNFQREPVEEVQAGDICAFVGMPDIAIGETVACKTMPKPLAKIEVEKPTVRMKFLVNTSPFAGKEGEFINSRDIKTRLERELEKNLALTVEQGESADEFVVCGRGTLHITILIETMRREGFEFQIGPPTVILKEENGEKLEPYEVAIVEAPEEFVGACVDLLGNRCGQMMDMTTSENMGTTTIKYRLPTRGLLGLKNHMLTATKGTAVLNTIFDGYDKFSGEIKTREQGSLVAFATGQSTQYALKDVQERGQLFIAPGMEIYEGQVIGIHQRSGDLPVNAAKAKKATNVRSNAEIKVQVAAPKEMSLDDCIEYITGDELVEVTPKSIRMRKNPKGLKGGKLY
ncbi:GTP-binding protein TypA [Chloropicon primus]|uniref:GTP-binding protein TypA n=1 Tax=Chloropicon primus TaxID=1764295 RepID=A0A5B8MD81_9CHLO|nr:GTP-binding protein TypA [Chloropicon primus]UPQ97715.1 GTP-binding protein TypA [Chloropicon primus]|eukprot:QDZ18506.1 GTP-binding protein TypA [Chloropicon primus]